MARNDPVPQPGPADVPGGAGPDEWIEAAKECKYLPENDMKRLCEVVKEFLMEGVFDQPFHCQTCTRRSGNTLLLSSL